MDAIPTKLVLDSWPILEWLKGRQPSTRNFRQILDAVFSGETELAMSRINYGEVLYSIRKDFPPERIEAAHRAFLELPIRYISVDDAMVDEAAALKAVYTCSYADCFAVALAIRSDAPPVTGDKELLMLREIGLQVLWTAV
ncbi:MAG TPA: type II toxin-antitoxin system VapC family toxin [Acidobacteriaceae bacterium]|nr:type II toxin-antitoxin system VapC family toxin [Acidobacteriaceae bacterium]